MRFQLRVIIVLQFVALYVIFVFFVSFVFSLFVLL